ERHARFTNVFDKFSTEAGKSLTSVYERFSTLVNNMDQNKIKPNEIAINTKFLNSLQPEWIKFFTLTRQYHTLNKEHFDKLYDYLSQCEPYVNASRAKRNARNHDPLALVANSYANPSYSHASPSYSQSPQPYYVTHSLYVHDYDDDYQGEIQGEAQEDKLSKRVVWEKALVLMSTRKMKYFILLICGEAANARCLPECLCYIFYSKEEILFGCMFHRKYGVTVSQTPLGPSYHLQVLPKLWYVFL
ncbi:integrase, catalytic region, zinc finger, CCHC-type containing protein, partial [Tanacetum coccineum]